MTKILLFAAMILTLFVSIGVGQTTKFTYQGKLLDGGAAANGPYDMRFRLFDEATGGIQKGSDQMISGVIVTSGIFTVSLDFGSEDFDGNERFIEVSVSHAGQVNYVTLTPRQAINAAPYAIKALAAESSAFADEAGNSMNLGGAPASDFVLTGDARLTDARHPLPGSGDYIQNQTGGQQSANFEIGGVGKASSFDTIFGYRVNGNRILSAGNGNVFLGAGTGDGNISGTQNVFAGESSGLFNTTGGNNSFFGFTAGRQNLGGSDNVFFGMQAGRENTDGFANTFAGRSSGFINTTGYNNSFFGHGSGAPNTTGHHNTAVGFNSSVGSNTRVFGTAIGAFSTVTSDDTIVLGKIAGTYDGMARPADSVFVPGTLSVAGSFQSNILSATTQFNIGASRILHSPGSNLFIGRSAGVNYASGSFNTAVGSNAGVGNSSGSANSLFGSQAGFDNHGSENSFFGMNAGVANQNGGANSFFGKEAGSANIDGSANSFFGIGTGAGNTNGSSLTLIGSAANVGADGLTFATAVGAGAVVSASNTLVLGRGSDTVQVPGSIDTSGSYQIAGKRVLGISGDPMIPNLFGGVNAGLSNTTGVGNTYFGSNAGMTNTTGSANAFFGTQTGRNSTGFGNSLFGNGAGFELTSGSSNAFFGASAGLRSTTAGNNSFFGASAGQEAISGGNNSYFGTSAGLSGTSAAFNVFVGSGAGISNETGAGNTVVGAIADFSAPANGGNNNSIFGFYTRAGVNLTNATAIGAFANVTQSNSLVLGSISGVNGAAADTNVGIGTTAPKAKLDVSGGDILIGAPGAGIILKSSTGNTCVKLTIDDTPTFIGTIVPCP